MAVFNYTKISDLVTVTTNALLALSAATSIIANPASTITMVGGIDVHNTQSSAATIILLVVPNSALSLGTPSLSCELFRVTLQGFDTFSWEPNIPAILSLQNDAIFGVASLSGVNAYPRGAKYA